MYTWVGNRKTAQQADGTITSRDVSRRAAAKIADAPQSGLEPEIAQLPLFRRADSVSTFQASQKIAMGIRRSPLEMK